MFLVALAIVCVVIVRASIIPVETVCRGVDRRDGVDMVMHIFRRPKPLAETTKNAAMVAIVTTRNGTEYTYIDPNCLKYEKRNVNNRFYNYTRFNDWSSKKKAGTHLNKARGCVSGTFGYPTDNYRGTGRCRVKHPERLKEDLMKIPYWHDEGRNQPSRDRILTYHKINISNILGNINVGIKDPGFMVCLPDVVVLGYPKSVKAKSILLPPSLNIQGVPLSVYEEIARNASMLFPWTEPREYVKYRLAQKLKRHQCMIFPASDSVCTKNLISCGQNQMCNTTQAYSGVDDWVEAARLEGPQKECVCKEGYNEIPHDGCQDIDECAMDYHKCNPDVSRCVNKPGGYLCQPNQTSDCPEGYEYKNKECVDLDECAMDYHECNPDVSRCVNKPGGYLCQPNQTLDCPEGYEYKNKECVDLDECKSGIDGCDAGSTDCVNIPGSYRCDCKDDQHEHIASLKECVPVTYEYRLLDPSKIVCCHHRGNGVFIMWGRKLSSDRYTHLSKAGCLMMSNQPLPPNYVSNSLTMYRVGVAGGETKTKLEAESLAAFSEWFQASVNSRPTRGRGLNYKTELHTAIRVGSEEGCYAVHVKPIPTMNEQNESVIVMKKLAYVLVDSSVDTFVTPRSRLGTCTTLPKNVAWLNERLLPVPKEDPSLYNPRCPRSTAVHYERNPVTIVTVGIITLFMLFELN